MTRDFKGTINVDIRDSVPDWEPFEPPQGPGRCTERRLHRPRRRRVLGDELLRRADRDAEHRPDRQPTACATPSCTPPRCARRRGRACSPAATTPATAWPASPRPRSGSRTPAGRSRRRTGCCPRSSASSAGTRTWSASGTSAPTDEMNLASTRRNWPSGRGFERWYGFLGAETSQWYPELVYDNHPVDQPKSPEEGYHLSVDITDKAIEFICDAKVVAPEKPFFLYYSPGACHAPHHAPKEWIDKFKGQFDMGYEAMREQTLARQKELGLDPRRHGAAADQPDRHPRDPQRTRRQAVPDDGRHPPVGFAVGRREAAVLTDGRGVRRVPGPCRRSDRSAARLPRVHRRAREHADHARLRQRCQRRGRPERLGQRDAVHERHPRRHRSQNLADPRRSRRPEDLQPLPERLGDGVQHTVQDVEALRVRRRHRRPVHHLVAGRDEGPRRDPRRSTTMRSTSSRRSSTCSASSRRRRSRATCRATSTA